MKVRIIAAASFLVIFSFCALVYSEVEAKGRNDEVSRQDAFEKFTKVVHTIEKYYVDEIEIDEIIDKALNGLLSNLDAHSSYLDSKQFGEMQIKTSGKFGGLGIHVGMRDGALTVVAPIEGTPADKAGIESGDIILKIDDRSTIGMNIDEAVELMRGTPNSPIRITIVRKSMEKPLEIPLVRAIINVQSVYAKTYKSDILYLRVTNFDANVAESLKKEITSRKATTKGIILDLRNNPGGLLDPAIKTVDIFIEDGVIVSQKGRVEKENKTFTASKRGTISDIPLVVLVNGGSASASEIVSGSLQDHRRAVIVGERTFGKGSVQLVMPLDEPDRNNAQDAIRITIARYYLPSGRTIQATGVEPDVEIKRASLKEVDDDFAIKEAQLKDHLEAQLSEISSQPKQAAKPDDSQLTNEQLNEDYQLKSALGILRGLIVLQDGKR
ncbi:MAG: S41 family peptidase [Helicobacteraceae bacterium]|nr:S41 family peptidase [Helicobacteraceae bacterium]